MALIKRGNVWWIDIHNTHADKRLRVSTRTGDRKLAAIKHAEAERAIVLGAALPQGLAPRAATLGDAFDRALRLDLKGLKSAVTIGFHRDRIFESISRATPLAQIDVGAIDRLVAALEARGNGPGTINRTMQTLRRVLTLAKGWGMVDAVAVLPRRREPDGRIRVYTREEEAAVLEFFGRDLPMRTLTVLLIDTGMRLGEALAYGHMILEGDVVRLWATKASTGEVVGRSIPLTRRAAEAARLWHATRPFATKDQIEWRWRSMREALFPGDGDAIIHALRHTCCTRLIRAGVPIAKVMLWMGHRDYKTTLRYTHMDAGDLSSAAAALEQVPADSPPVTAPVTAPVPSL